MRVPPKRLVVLLIAIAGSFPLWAIACDGDGNSDTLPIGADAGVSNAPNVVRADAGSEPSTPISPPPPLGIDAAPPLAVTTIDPCRGFPVNPLHGYVPPGMCEMFIGWLPNVRQLTFGANGDLFATTGYAIHLLRDEDGNGFFSPNEIHEWAQTGGQGIYSNNAHIDLQTGFVYAGSEKGIRRFAYTVGALTAGPSEDVVIGQPIGGHTRRTVRVYDGWLYVNSGSFGNIANETSTSSYDTKRSLIARFNLSTFVPGQPFQWDAGERVTLGVRNANGFARNEFTKKIYAVVNGIDDLTYKNADVHQDNPGEQVVEISSGKNYGFPFCFTAQRVVDSGALIPAGTQLVNVGFPDNPHNDVWCAANSLVPTTFVQAHSAPLDITFFDRQPIGALPEKWRGGAFIAMHGSGNRTQPTGAKVVWQPFNADGTSPKPITTLSSTTFPYEVVFGGGDNETGPRDGGWTWGSQVTTDAGFDMVDAGSIADGVRPAGVVVSPIDGALYVASDAFGSLYRVGLIKH